MPFREIVASTAEVDTVLVNLSNKLNLGAFTRKLLMSDYSTPLLLHLLVKRTHTIVPI
jgi:hypothetical protein